DLAADVPALAHAGDDDASLDGVENVQSRGECAVERLGQRGHALGLEAEHPPRGIQVGMNRVEWLLHGRSFERRPLLPPRKTAGIWCRSTMRSTRLMAAMRRRCRRRKSVGEDVLVFPALQVERR